MAKTLMISNDTYEELKKMKGKRSFTETIKYLINKKDIKKTGDGLKKFLGVLKGDNEYDKIMKELKPLYKKWTKKYA